MDKDTKASIIPLYLIADESASMMTFVDQTNRSLRSLLDQMHMNSDAAERARFTLIGFNSEARCHLRRANLNTITQLPALGASGRTSYQAALDALTACIDEDVDALSPNNVVLHPAVFIVTDGDSNEGGDWLSVHAKLTDPDNPRRPNILAFGVDGATRENVLALATEPEYAFMAEAGVSTGEALRRFFDHLVRSLIQTSREAAAGEVEVELSMPPGFVRIGHEPTVIKITPVQ